MTDRIHVQARLRAMRLLSDAVLWLQLMAWLVVLAWPLPASEADPYRSKPKSHESNKKQAAIAYEGNLKKYANDNNMLVLLGLVADKKGQQVAVMVESTCLGPDAPCEFTIIDETSDHGYESLLISFARPSDIHRALQFIGKDPGEPFDPGSLRFWAKGELFILSIVKTNEPPIRLEKLLVDRRTGQSLREDGFLFTGSRMLPAFNDSLRKVYAADEFQPKSIVSLFNSTYSVFEVPYMAPKSEVYQNTTINPDHAFSEGALLSLLIEPAQKDDSKRVKDIILHVESEKTLSSDPLKGIELLTSLSLKLKDSETVLNSEPNILSVIESLAALDRKKYFYYLTVSIGDNVELGQAQALANILSTIDCEKGVRIEPPPAGHLHYRAFTPDQRLLDRAARVFHPWELSLVEKEGRVLGKLLRIDSVWRKDVSVSELDITELSIFTPQDLCIELDSDAERARKADIAAKPPVIMVFASSSLHYGKLKNFLEPILPTYKMIHVYVDRFMPPNPEKKHNQKDKK